MSKVTLSLDQVLSLLRETPQRIADTTDGLSPAQIRVKPSPDQWSVNEVLAHLRSCADVWGDAIARILAEDHPTVRAIDPRSWITRTDYRQQEFATSFRAFAEQRAGLLATLESLSSVEWARAATVTGAGKPLERTVLTFAGRMARHERAHVKQIGRIVATVRD